MGLANANAVSNGMTNGGAAAGPSMNRPPLSSAQSDGAALQQQHQQQQVDPVAQRLTSAGGRLSLVPRAGVASFTQPVGER